MELGHYLEMLRVAEEELAAGLRAVGAAHTERPDVGRVGGLLASWCDRHVAALEPVCARYAAHGSAPPEALHAHLFHGPREGGLGLLRDLHDVYLQATSADVLWTLVGQAAKANRDRGLDALAGGGAAETARTLQWLTTTLKTAAPHALVVA